MENWSIILLLFIVVVLTGIVTILFNSFFAKIKQYITTLGVSFVLSLICVHLLPEVFEGRVKNIGAYLLLGFTFQIILELFSRGIEHGHVHHHKEDYNHSVNRTLTSMFFGLCIHSFIEGMPMFVLADPESHIGHFHHVVENSGEFSSVFFWAIIGHKIPVAIVLMSFLLQSSLTRPKVYGLFILFAMMSPFGAIMGLKYGVGEFSTVLLAITTGMLIHITTLLVFEEYHNQKDKIKNITLIIIGLSLGLFVF